jgi:hypothetical protein
MADERFGDAALQSAYQAWMRGDRGEHLDDNAWLRLAAGDAVQSERDLLFAHIVTCTECSEVWRGLSLLKHDAQAAGLIAPRVNARRSFFRSMFLPLAAAATIAIAIGAVLMRERAPVADAARGVETLSAVEGLMMAYAADGTPTLIWTPAPAATDYHVEIFSEDGRPLWAGDVATPPMRWPAELTRAKGTYRWRVEAQNADAAVARSRLTVVELTQ